jgi:hypothetical protein
MRLARLARPGNPIAPSSTALLAPASRRESDERRLCSTESARVIAFKALLELGADLGMQPIVGRGESRAAGAIDRHVEAENRGVPRASPSRSFQD